MKGSDSSLYECSISYNTLKRSFASRILTTTSGLCVMCCGVDLFGGQAALTI
jgi:hypothetical protein